MDSQARCRACSHKLAYSTIRREDHRRTLRTLRSRNHRTGAISAHSLVMGCITRPDNPQYPLRNHSPYPVEDDANDANVSHGARDVDGRLGGSANSLQEAHGSVHAQEILVVTMLILKDSSVIHDGLVPEMHYGLGVAAALKYRLFGLNCVVTALLDGVHNPGSLHPLGRAADLRARDLREDEAILWYEAIKQELEPMGFDCVWEGGVGATPVTTGAHVHLEFQPKAGESFWHLAN